MPKTFPDSKNKIKTLTILPSCHHGCKLSAMTAPQLSVRSAKARDLAHQLSAKEKRPIHAIVEDALVAYANRQPKENPEAFLRRLGAIGGKAEVDDLADLEAFIAENRKPHSGVDL
jgi:hypothetical protein